MHSDSSNGMSLSITSISEVLKIPIASGIGSLKGVIEKLDYLNDKTERVRSQCYLALPMYPSPWLILDTISPTIALLRGACNVG